MRTTGYLCEREVLNLCVSHQTSPWAGSDPTKCHIHVIDRTEMNCNYHSLLYPAEFWFVCENGTESFLGYADWIETAADGSSCEGERQPVLRCLSGDVYDSLNEMRDHLSNLDWSER